MTGRIRYVAPLVLALAQAGCVLAPRFDPPSPAAAFVGVWIDSLRTSPLDTVTWMLARDGSKRVRYVSVRTDPAGGSRTSERIVSDGHWYLSGPAGDAAGRRFCFKRRPMDGATCIAFHLDTLRQNAPGATRRRLALSSFDGGVAPASQVLLEQRRS